MPILKFLADTNVVSDWMRGEESIHKWFAVHADEVAICTITLAELRRGIELKEDGKLRRELERRFRFVLETFEGGVWVFDEAAAFEWARLMAEARAHPLPYDDSLIAAIARSMEATVVTRNVKDFPGCPTFDPLTGKQTLPWRTMR
jgi:predicted nucleic acid-binding protein